MEKYDEKILLELGVFTTRLKNDAIDYLKVGQNILDVIEFVENRIFDAGYIPAFPCTICINEEAAHFTVYDEEIFFKKGDVVKIDFGVAFDGYLTDTAFTVEIETNEFEDLLKANKEALDIVVDFVDVGVSMGEIGEKVNSVAKKNGFNTIHNLSGHEIMRNDLHAGLQVPNYDNKSSAKIPKTTELAIEPFFTIGSNMIKEGKKGNILHYKGGRPVRDVIAKKVLLYIKENFSMLPFSKRWLLKKFDKKKVDYALKILKRDGIVYEYGVLVSEDNSIISQFEDTVLFVDGKKTIITRLE